MTWLQLVALAGIGVFAGAVNTVAGGGSLITIPALIFFGLPASMANATNRIGVILQSAIATWQFDRAGRLDRQGSLAIAIPVCLGALAGSFLSIDIDEQLFKRIIGVAMLIMLVILLVKPGRWLGRPDAAIRRDTRAFRLGQILGFFAIGVYGGFLQAGVGIFLLGALVLLAGRDLVTANAVKSLLVALFTVPAVIVFQVNGLVAWQPGLALAVGSGLGGWLGSKLTVSWGPAFVRWVLVVVVAISSARLLGLW